MSISLAVTRDLPSNSQRQHILFAGTADPRDRNKIGFLPWPAFEEAHLRGHLCTVARNDDLVGHCLWRCSRDQELHIVQVWVRPDARLIIHGRSLIDFVEREATKENHNLWQIRLWCATDLAANFFWRHLGFACQCWRWGPRANGRKHWLWTRRIKQLANHSHSHSCESSEALVLAGKTCPPFPSQTDAVTCTVPQEPRA